MLINAVIVVTAMLVAIAISIGPWWWFTNSVGRVGSLGERISLVWMFVCFFCLFVGAVYLAMLEDQAENTRVPAAKTKVERQYEN